MTLAAALLPRLSDWRPAGEGRHRHAVALPGRGYTLHLDADRVESLGARLWELQLGPDAAGDRDLKVWSGRVAGRATGLLELLTPLEVDDRQGIALLRSKEPARSGVEVGYYEVELRRDGAAAVRRYHNRYGDGARREQVPFTVTHEALVKLVNDLLPD